MKESTQTGVQPKFLIEMKEAKFQSISHHPLPQRWYPGPGPFPDSTILISTYIPMIMYYGCTAVMHSFMRTDCVA